MLKVMVKVFLMLVMFMTPWALVSSIIMYFTGNLELSLIILICLALVLPAYMEVLESKYGGEY